MNHPIVDAAKDYRGAAWASDDEIRDLFIRFAKRIEDPIQKLQAQVQELEAQIQKLKNQNIKGEV